MEIVNGFPCKNCTDVDYAKKHIDPAHPKDGPYGIDAADNPANAGKPRTGPAVTFGGRLQGVSTPAPSTAARTGVGANLDVSA